jgi:L-threonylcarbamoyladenylate synthase
MASIISQCSLDVLRQAAENLKTGGLVAFPTETVYGIGADAENSEAITRMYAVKGRPADHPVIVHIADLDAVDYWANFECQLILWRSTFLESLKSSVAMV